MNETQWSEDSGEKPKKKSFPKWVFFCGGGCLLAVIAAIVIGIFAFKAVKKGMDPEFTWPALQKVLPFDERPPAMTITFHSSIGMEQFMILDSRGFQLQLQVHNGADGDQAREKLFGGDEPEIPKDMAVMTFEDIHKTEFDMQGIERPVIRLKMGGFMKDMMPKDQKGAFGGMVWTDVTPEGHPGFVFLQLSRIRGEGEITDDELREVLAPFKIGPKR